MKNVDDCEFSNTGARGIEMEGRWSVGMLSRGGGGGALKATGTCDEGVGGDVRRDVGNAVGVFGMLRDKVGFEVFKDSEGRGIEIALERQRYWWKAIRKMKKNIIYI